MYPEKFIRYCFCSVFDVVIVILRFSSLCVHCLQWHFYEGSLATPLSLPGQSRAPQLCTKNLCSAVIQNAKYSMSCSYSC